MEELHWTEEQKKLAQAAVMERFASNSVAKQFVPEVTVAWTETTVRWNRFDFQRRMVNDNETLGLFEPYAFVNLSRAQGDEASLERAKTTLNRAASALARWHDALVFAGFDLKLNPKPPGIEMPPCEPTPIGLRQAAIQAEGENKSGPIPVDPQNANESLVAAVYEAVLRLEGFGYYRGYHLVLGQQLWRELNSPNPGALVLPKDRIEPTLAGGGFYRTTTLPDTEAFVASLDGPTFDCVTAGPPAEQPKLEFLRAQGDDRGEEIYKLRVRERFAPRVRENRAVVRIVLGSAKK
ncbi:MAG: bacteriocin family protein [Nitrospira sp.]|nr:bacteriocin family protein [Nitrospira sp.]